MNQFWHLHYSIDQPLHIVTVTLITIVLSFGLLLATAILNEQASANIKQAQTQQVDEAPHTART